MSLCTHPELLKGYVHTGFIEEHKNVLLAKNVPNPEIISQVCYFLLLTFIIICNINRYIIIGSYSFNIT